MKVVLARLSHLFWPRTSSMPRALTAIVYALAILVVIQALRDWA